MYDYSDESVEEDDNEECGILKKALDVVLPDDFDPNSVPQTGEEYLHHVMYERNKCQTWITANIDTKKLRNKQTFKLELDEISIESRKNILPTKEWERSKIEDFTAFRKLLESKLEATANTVSSFDEEQFQRRFSIETPKFTEITAYTQAAKIRILQIISKHIYTLIKGDPECSGLSEATGTWLYGLLALLEKPLSPSSCYTLREFAKRCRQLRARHHTIRPDLNLFISIVAIYFNQLDLAD